MLQPEKRVSRTIKKVKRKENSLVLQSDYGLTCLIPLNESIIRVVFTQKEEASFTLGAGFNYVQDFSGWTYEESHDDIKLRTKSIMISTDKKTGSLRYYHSDGKLILAERNFESRILEEFDSFKTIENENSKTENIVTPDGVKQRLKTSEKIFDKKLYRTQIHFNLQEDESLFGLGQSPEGAIKLRGTTQYGHQANLKIALPFLISSKGYGILLSTGSPFLFHDDDYGSYLQTEADIQMDFYFISGDSYKDIIKSYRFLTGKAAMLPKWAFGYIQSQERYETAEEIINIAKEYKKRRIKLGCVVLDWMTWEEGQWGQKTFDTTRFPDPSSMTEELHALDTRLMISIWPNMSKSCDNYKEFKEKKLLLPNSDIYNAFTEEGRKLYWKQVNEGLFKYGIDAWWCDSSEPVTPEWVKIEKPEPSSLYHEFINEAGNLIPRELSNTFGLFHAKGICEGQRNVCSTKRVMNLTRSGYTGQQKYGTVLWSGDISASWETLRKQITAGLHFCACGLPYWTLDIGAFFVKRGKPWFWNGDYEEGSNDLGYRELYVRWFQYGAFLPIFRAHGTDTRREVWAFGEKNDPFYDALCAAIELRYALMPYIYSLAGAVWHDDATMIRFLTFDFPDDSQTKNSGDQYMFGPSLMVCPVTEPMYYNADSKPIEDSSFSKSVYLPKGCNWYDFFTNTKYEGGKRITIQADIKHIPVFVREGSILPMEEADSSLTFRIYSGRDGEFNFYDDSGDGYAYENGEYRLVKYLWDDTNKLLSKEIIHKQGEIAEQSSANEKVVIV